MDPQNIKDIIRQVKSYDKTNPQVSTQEIFHAVMENENFHGDRMDITAAREEFAREVNEALEIDLEPHPTSAFPALGSLIQPDYK